MHPVQQTNVSANKGTKVLIYIGIFLAAIPIVFIAILVYMYLDFSVFSKQRDEVSIRQAALDIEIPSSLKQTSSNYADHKCLDVCANLTNMYSLGEDFQSASKTIGEALLRKGYSYEDESYTKNIKNNDVDIFIESYEEADYSDEYLVVRIEIDKDYLTP